MRTLAILGILVAMVVGCEGAVETGKDLCTPGDTEACTCKGGAKGVNTCVDTSNDSAHCSSADKTDPKCITSAFRGCECGDD